MPTEKDPSIGATASNYNIVRIGVFEDDIAYGGKRGVYEVYDSKGNLLYFGISGIGIAEVSSHSAGKTTVSDER